MKSKKRIKIQRRRTTKEITRYTKSNEKPRRPK